MRQIFSSPNSVEIGLVKDRLEAAGVRCKIRNEAVSQALVGTPFEPGIWVLRDEDYEASRRIIAGH